MARKLPNFIDKEEFNKIFSTVLKEKKKNYKQIALAMLLAFEAGLRISEVVGIPGRFEPLQASQVSIERNTIKITGKGKGEGKERIVPLPKRVNANALKMLPLTVSRRTLERWVKNLGKRILGKDIHFHTLRHGFGSHLASNGLPLHEIQMLMGHSRMDTTGIYLHANPKKAVEGAREVF